MAQNHLRNVVLVGATGNAGSPILASLLATGRFDITVLSRPESTAAASLPDSVHVVKGSYDDAAFLKSAFTGADVVVFTLNHSASSKQNLLIDAAVKAGVEWILPNEFAGDGTNTKMVDDVPVFHPKREAREQIRKLGAKFIGISTGPWTSFVVQYGLLDINLKSKQATLYSDTAPFNQSTFEQLGRGVAALLSLPIENSSNPRASLSHYANNFVYLSSMFVSQSQLFDAIKRATSTSDSDWSIERKSNEARIEQKRAAMLAGDQFAGLSMCIGYYIGAGRGGDVESKSAEDRAILGLSEENIDDVVKRLVAGSS